MIGDDLERIERLELHLRPGAAGWAPTCYRLWLAGTKDGWPKLKAKAAAIRHLAKFGLEMALAHDVGPEADADARTHSRRAWLPSM